MMSFIVRMIILMIFWMEGISGVAHEVNRERLLRQTKGALKKL